MTQDPNDMAVWHEEDEERQLRAGDASAATGPEELPNMDDDN